MCFSWLKVLQGSLQQFFWFSIQFNSPLQNVNTFLCVAWWDEKAEEKHWNIPSGVKSWNEDVPLYNYNKIVVHCSLVTLPWECSNCAWAMWTKAKPWLWDLATLKLVSASVTSWILAENGRKIQYFPHNWQLISIQTFNLWSDIFAPHENVQHTELPTL